MRVAHSACRAAVIQWRLLVYVLAAGVGLHECFGNASFFSVSPSESESGDIFQLALTGPGPLLADGPTEDEDPFGVAWSSGEQNLRTPVKSLRYSGRLAGWFFSAWEAGSCQPGRVTEETLKAAARQAGESAAYSLGMRHFCIDSCWLEHQPSAGSSSEAAVSPLDLQPRKDFFPHGIHQLAETVTEEGLAFGLGITVSADACKHLEPPPPAARAMDVIHKATQWGAAFLKLTACSSSVSQAIADFKKWSDAARASSLQPLLVCLWTEEERDESTKGGRLEEMRSLCDVWLSPKRTFDSWPQLSAAVEAWLHSQQQQQQQGGPPSRVRRPAAAPPPRLGLPLSAADAASHAAQQQTLLALNTVLGSQLLVEAQNPTDFQQQTKLVNDDVVLAGDADPSNPTVRRSAGPGATEVFSRQLSDGDYLLLLLNWSSSAFSVSVSHADLHAWCGLSKPVPLIVSQAWAGRKLRMTAGRADLSLQQDISPHGALLLQVELTDSLEESQEALIFSEGPSNMWGGGPLSVFPVMDVFHSEEGPPAFSTSSRFVGPRGSALLGGSSLARQTEEMRESDNPIDFLLKTAVNLLLLPMMVASTLGGGEQEEGKHKKSHSEHKHHVHRKRHIHHKHLTHAHWEDEEEAEKETNKSTPNTPAAASSIRRAAAENGASKPAAAAAAADAAAAGGSGSEAARQAGSSDAWVLLGVLVVFVCCGLVVAWRSMFKRRTSKSKRRKSENTQLVSRPHLH
ncbi:hypothetical protein Efla_003458 [Eimeria flavescens]